MNMLKGIGTALCLTVICLLAAPKAKADEWNHKTTLTFSAPFEVPGVGQHTLPAGTYVFKLMESSSSRHIVQIFNQDETQVLTTVLAIPNYRLKATDKTVMTFRESRNGQPQSLKAWFYPGHEWGEHFVYDRTRAIELAKENNEAVLATPVVLADEPIEVLESAPIEAIAPTGETVQMASVVEAPPAPVVAFTRAPAATPEPVLVASLPKTASYLSLIGFAGLLMLGGGFFLTGLLKRSA